MKPSPLDAESRRRHGRGFIAGAATCAVHAGLVALAFAAGTRALPAGAAPAISELFEIQPHPEPPPAEPELPPEPAPRALPAASKPKLDPTPKEPEPPRVAEPPTPPAEAGPVLDAVDTVDFGDAFVTGQGRHHAGGVTQPDGTASRAVPDPTARGGPGAARPAARAEVDRSRPPALAGGAVWDCPFPIEADEARIDRAVVALSVQVSARGEVQRVTVTADPGHGFGREARRCAKTQRWSPGLDRSGAPAPSVAVVRVGFERR